MFLFLGGVTMLHKFKNNKLYLVGFRNDVNKLGEFTYRGNLMRGNHYALILPFSKMNKSVIVIPTTSAKPKHFDENGRLLLKESVYDPRTKSIFLIGKLEITDMSKSTHYLFKRKGKLVTHRVDVNDKTLKEINLKMAEKFDKQIPIAKDKKQEIEKEKQVLLNKVATLERENANLKQQIKFKTITPNMPW